MSRETYSKTLFVSDGDCGFCRYWVRYWKQLTGAAVEYRVFEEVPELFKNDSTTRQSSHFFSPTGEHFRGARGIAELLSYAPGKKAFRFFYCSFKPFAWISEWMYRRITLCRTCAAHATKFLWGTKLEPSRFLFTRRLFLRLLGLVYLIAFVSFGSQLTGLIGENGILPAGMFLDRVHETYGAIAVWKVPTLAWISSSDLFLFFLVVVGAVFALLAIIGFQISLVFLVLWVLYLSLFWVGQVFMGFQWDILLLEVGFLAIFFAPTRLWNNAPPSMLIIWLYRFLVFRLMFFSGFVKLASGDPTWRSLSALDFHYFTQPLPNPIAWFAHQMSSPFDHVSVLATFAIQLVLPFFIFAPRRLRFFAAGCFLFLEGLIALTGNYTFFNLLTISLILLLFDDSFFRRKKTPLVQAQKISFSQKWIPRALVITILMLFVFQISTPFRLVNSYGLFAVMTTVRPEIVIEGSMDGETWQAYEFKYKPGNLYRAPPFVAPHQPRIDWQMWFAALGSYDRQSWFTSFMKKLLEGSPDVLALLEHNPFPKTPPKYIRALLFEYEFTTREEREKTGAWWKRTEKGLYLPPARLSHDPEDFED